MSLMESVNRKALRLGLPLSVHLDITYRCNERCEHCYLDHAGHDELTFDEIRSYLPQFADAGVFFLTISGGEPLLRRDCFDILELARQLQFNVKLKTNATLIGEREARRLRALAVEQVQVSVYSHRPELHDAITKLPGSFERTILAIRRMREAGLKVTLANVLMRSNVADYPGVQALATQIGAHYTVDPTITPMLDGNTDVLKLRLPSDELQSVFRDARLVENVEEFCALPGPVDDEIREGIPVQRRPHLLLHFLRAVKSFPACSFPWPAATCATLRFPKSGMPLPSFARFVRSAPSISIPVLPALTSAHAPVVRDSLLWKATCSARPPPTAKNPLRAPASSPPECLPVIVRRQRHCMLPASSRFSFRKTFLRSPRVRYYR